jgi:protein gp37
MSTTRIPWATHTVNWLAGCSHISPACDHCYAEAMTARMSAMPNSPARYRGGVIKDGRWTGRLVFDADAMSAAFESLVQARQPRRVFAGSMSDLFHPAVPAESLADLARKICDLGAVRHKLLLLTKRPHLLLDWQQRGFPRGLPTWVWVGVTAEDQQRADERIPVLLQVQAAVRFVSVEPMLGPIDLCCVQYDRIVEIDALTGDHGVFRPLRGRGDALLSWVICGSENERDPRARPMDLAWVRSLRDQCQRAGVPFFYKAGPGLDGRRVECPELDGRTWTEVPG